MENNQLNNEKNTDNIMSEYANVFFNEWNSLSKDLQIKITVILSLSLAGAIIKLFINGLRNEK